MYKVDVLLGLQWGDEGKGKVVDYLAPKYEVIARFQGGPNAGHTLEFDGIKHVLHQIPSGIFRPGIMNLIGNGVVLDPITFQKEIEGLSPYNLNLRDSLVISNKAQLILPTHRLLDRAYEQSKGDKKIGSTLRGIGPTYQDKIGRLGLRVGDVVRDDFKKRYIQLRDHHLSILNKMGIDPDVADEEAFFEGLEVLRSYRVASTEYHLQEQLRAGKRVLAEGAQGSMLDIDFGSYPYVTSSSTTAAGACNGLGIAPHQIGEVFGIFKAYCTRVGSGPFPTELHDSMGEHLRRQGGEFGATTGRPRRCGWLDLPALRYAVQLSGVTQLYMMKVDVLCGLPEIQVCEAYEYNGESIGGVPFYYETDVLSPVYRSLDGWDKVGGVSAFDQLPKSLRDFTRGVEEAMEVPVNLISYGPDREQTIFRH